MAINTHIGPSNLFTEQSMTGPLLEKDQYFKKRKPKVSQIFTTSRLMQGTPKSSEFAQNADTPRPGSNIITSDTTTRNLNPRPIQEPRWPKKRGKIHINPDMGLTLLLPTPMIPNQRIRGRTPLSQRD